MKQLVKLFLLISSVSFIVSCSYNPFIRNNHTTGSPTAAAIGAGASGGLIAAVGGSKPLIAIAGIGGGMFGYYITTLRHDSGPILAAGGNVYVVGKYVGIYIPSHVIFEANTAQLLPQAVPILESAAKVLKRFGNNNIMISGNTSGFYKAFWEYRLSEFRARAVSAYLWRAGINNFKERSNDTRRLNYVGYGDFFPIAQNYTNRGIRENSSIQIISYPGNCDLHLDRLKQTVYNIGAASDQTLKSAMIACDKSDPNCVELD